MLEKYTRITTANDEVTRLGKKVRGTNNTYDIPLLEYNMKILRENGYEITRPNFHTSLDHPKFNTLYQYQKEVVQDLIGNDLPGNLLFLSPGLGKGAVSIIASELLEVKQVLIVCSLTLIPMWIEQLKQWSKDGEAVDYKIWYRNDCPDAKYIITNTETFSGKGVYNTVNGKRKKVAIRRLDSFDKTWDLLIWDESLLLKNRDSNRFIALKQTQYNRLFLLSGNPASRYYDDLWTQLNRIWPNAFSSYWSFADRYCTIDNTNPYSRFVTGNRRDIPSHDYSDIILKRVKQNVLPDLPPLIFRRRELELGEVQRTLHDGIRDEFIATLESGESISVSNRLAAFTRMAQTISSSNNLPDITTYESIKHEAIMDMLEASDIEFPAIIWLHWVAGATKLLERVRDEYKTLRVVQAFGNVDKAKAFDEYKKGKYDIVFASIVAGKHGLTLTDTKSVIHLDRIFDLDAWLQTNDRVHRIGLKHSPTVTILEARNSMDTIISDNLAGKIPGIARLADIEVLTLLKGIR